MPLNHYTLHWHGNQFHIVAFTVCVYIVPLNHYTLHWHGNQFHNVAFTVCVYKVTHNKLIQHCAHLRVQKLLCRQATLLAATTTTTREVQHHGPKHHFCGLSVLLHTVIFSSQALQHRVCLCHTSHKCTGMVGCTVKSGGLVGYLVCA